MRKIKAIICPANGMPYVANVSDNLESLQRIVGGHIEVATVFEDVLAICNEEGRLLNLPENQSMFCDGFRGGCLICGVDKEWFASLPGPVRKILLQSCKARYKKAPDGGGKLKMVNEKLIRALKTLRVQTGSLACMGCGYEHNCGVHGCAILREAVKMLSEQDAELIQARANAGHYKGERDRAVAQLRKLADCSTCRKEVLEGVDGPECACCLRGEKWEWDEGMKKHG